MADHGKLHEGLSSSRFAVKVWTRDQGWAEVENGGWKQGKLDSVAMTKDNGSKLTKI